MVDIISLLSTDGYIMCNKTLIKLYGSDCAILIGELCAEYNYYKITGELIDNSFYSTQENIESNTGINAYYQRKAFKVLQDEGIILVVKKGIPAKNYYTINTEKLAEIFAIASCEEAKGLAVQALNINNNKQNKINKIVSKDTNINNIASEIEFDFGIQEKPKKKNLFDKCLDIIYEWTNDKKLQDLLVQYLKVCLEMKSIRGANQWKGMLNTLEKVQLQCQPHTYEEIIEQAIIRGWKTFYPIKDYVQSNNSKFIHIQKSSEFVEPEDDELKQATDENGKLMVY